MPLRKTISVLVLIFLIAVLAYIANARGLRPALGGPPAVLEGRFVKEEAWIVDEIVHDITEMAAYPTKVRGEVTIARSAEGIYRVGVGSQGPAAVDIDLREDLWAPAQFRALARATLDTAPSSAVRSNEAASPVYPALLTLTPATLVTTSAAISRALAADMRDPDLHEAAALTLGAFALRESAERFSDMRWAMNRMTAHLTIAAALRRDAPPGIDGQLATSVLWMLANHQTRALQALDATAPDRRDEALDSWKRAVRVHLTQDRRTIAKPAGASLLEKREYFRAYRATGPWTTGLAALEQLDVAPTADWLRIIEQYGVVVSDRDVMSRMLDAERAESDEVFQRIHGRAIADWNTALNARAGRLIDASGPQVLPWGAWAEFAQRHLAMFIDRTDAFYRHTIGNEHVADTEKVRLKRQLGSLRIFPIATIFWTKGVAGGDADLGLINEAISAAVAAPELVPAAAWSFLADGSRYEPVRRSMPPPDAWFVAPAPRAPYEAGTRIRDTHARIAAVTIDSMLRGAPYDARLASEYLTVTFGARPPAAEIRRAFGPRLEYDERTLRSARTFTPEDDATERLQLAKTACELYAAECITLGYDLAAVNREADAAAAFERAFADPSLDAVALSNSSGWLVSYYHRHGRIRSAADLAERAASTGAFAGLVAQGYLFERVGRLRDAETLYRRSAAGYDNWSPLLGFYYRAVNVRHERSFEEAWKTALARIFPDGLAPVTTSQAAPAHGVVVTKDSSRSRAAGLQAGDIIVGLEGWRVDSQQQYTAINAFFERDQVNLTAWRGHLFKVSGTPPNRLFGIEFRTYPIAGWRER